jgi:hypothetical protein
MSPEEKAKVYDRLRDLEIEIAVKSERDSQLLETVTSHVAREDDDRTYFREQLAEGSRTRQGMQQQLEAVARSLEEMHHSIVSHPASTLDAKDIAAVKAAHPKP